MQFVRDLESQVNQISELYDLAEQQYPSEQFYGETILNDNAQRRKLQEFGQYGPTSWEILKGSNVFGLLSIYIMSRRGATGIFDLSQTKVCGYRTLSWFMLGCSVGMTVFMIRASEKYGKAAQINLHRRVSQNMQTQSLIRTMQHHLITRQGTIADQLPR